MMKLDYAFLYNKEKKLLAIGYHITDSRRDQAYYDLLASEARLASFLAIATGSLPQEHWFALGRQLTMLEGGGAQPYCLGVAPCLNTLCRLLILPTYEGTLLEQSCRNSIKSQIRYGKDHKVPWGISESGYNVTDANYNYQYRAFGVPELGFKRGLNQNLVIAPYASAMALMLEPQAACINLQQMHEMGFAGKYGFYEAVDYTSSHIPAGEKFAIVKSFMAHHQGMTFLSLISYLKNEPMQQRMKNVPIYKATELLLHERVPKVSAQTPDFLADPDITNAAVNLEQSFRIINSPSGRLPDAHLLGNGRYHVMITSAGSGYSICNNLMLTRWKADHTCDDQGYFMYVTDVEKSRSWSYGFQPLGKEGLKYEAIFSEGRAEFRRVDKKLATHIEIAVSPDDDTELRRATIINHSYKAKTIDITTYAEIVLSTLGEDQAHPAFNKLFVETEAIDDQAGLLCRRRPRNHSENSPWLYHAVVVHGGKTQHMGVETDREKFVGRNHNLKNPAALSRPLSNSTGPVLDPIVSIRKRITIDAGQSVTVDSIIGICAERQSALDLVDRYKEKHIADRVLELSWTHGHVLLHQLNCSTTDAILYGKMTGTIIYGGSNLRGDGSAIKANSMSQSSLWSYGISGDLPIILLRLHQSQDLKILKQIIKGHDYWRRKGVAVDLLIWNESHSSYRQDLHDVIIENIVMHSSTALIDQHGGIFIRRPDQMADEDRIMFLAVARIVLSDEMSSLEDQLTLEDNETFDLPKDLDLRLAVRKVREKPKNSTTTNMRHQDLSFDNGTGGFDTASQEYVIQLDPGESTPLPWVNILANEDFGTLVSESGSSYTWSENSHEHRLTPWFNDPVSDPTGEALFIRDEISGEYWSPTPTPRSSKNGYKIRHGFGYSIFNTQNSGVTSELTVFVPKDAPLKVIKIKLTNTSSKKRQLTVTSYFELVLGELRSKTASQIVTEWDPSTGLLKAKNTFAGVFKGRSVFLSATEPVTSVSGDRSEFIGRNGALRNPAAMKRECLSNHVGPLLDPCLAMQIDCELEAGESKELAFVFGSAQNPAEIPKLIKQFRSPSQIELALHNVQQFWTALLGNIQIETPDPSLNLLANGWLIYQTISSRIWGRTGFYQSGGAFGFRDQLQDMMAVMYSAPEIARKHIIRCASRQFIEGDVQHWWHPPQGKGVRTSFSDDFLWLPYVTAHYVKVTGDHSILDEETSYLTAELLEEGQESDYSLPTVSEQTGSIYEHCIKALKNSAKLGAHNLPLIGCGDWNDGMNHVGIEGKGESVWLAFFIRVTLKKFSSLAKFKADEEMINYCNNRRENLKESIAQSAWDGDWYLRAFFDDGTPLGTSKNTECRIDSLPQSWSVLDGGKNSRSVTAMESVYKHLVDHNEGIIRLFTPPFDKQLPNPGYIAGYLPGVRENGGQYTHAALWVIMAFAELGDIDRALELLTLINPINHSDTPEKASLYKVEPYVVPADIYSIQSLSGRGGWTWYTGSAALLYNTILESLLGFDLSGDKLHIKPRLPSSWQGFNLSFAFYEAQYRIEIKRTGLSKMTLDGIEIGPTINLTNDGNKHLIKIEME